MLHYSCAPAPLEDGEDVGVLAGVWAATPTLPSWSQRASPNQPLLQRPASQDANPHYTYGWVSSAFHSRQYCGWERTRAPGLGTLLPVSSAGCWLGNPIGNWHMWTEDASIQVFTLKLSFFYFKALGLMWAHDFGLIHKGKWVFFWKYPCWTCLDGVLWEKNVLNLSG